MLKIKLKSKLKLWYNNETLTTEKTILTVLTNKWQKVPHIQRQVAEKMGVAPNLLEFLVPLYCGVLTEHNKIETKPVSLEGGGYEPVCRKVQAHQEIPDE